MIFPRHFIVGTNHLGTTKVNYTMVHGERHPPCGYAFFCPTCGEIWARAPVQIGVEYSKFQSVSRGCAKHPQHALEVPGSLWLDWDREFTTSFPFGALLYEVELQLAHFFD